MNKCLYCYEPLSGEADFHEKYSQEFFGTKVPPKIPYSLDEMAELAKQIVQRSISVPGVQPKLSLSSIEEAEQNYRLTLVGALEGSYILKPPHPEFKEMPENEHVTMRIAESFGIQVVPSSLIRLSSGELSYITKRIDRTKEDEKIHMIDMFQITEAFNKYKSSMEKIGKVIDEYSINTLLDKIRYFDLSLFIFLTGNSDMHLKNFSMIETQYGWSLAPAYDLLNVSLVIPKDDEELALALGGKRKKLKKKHFIDLAKRLGLNEKQMQRAFERIVDNKPKAINWIEKSFLSKEMKEAYIKILESRYKQIELEK